MLFVFSIFPLVLSYGRVGHALSGAIAQELLNQDGLNLVTTLLGDKFNGKLSSACNWGDQIKSDHSYDWAKKLHYINPIHDDPPRTCSYHPGPEDCADNICVTAAIHNFTNQLIHPTPDTNKQEALLFLVHFIGDIHQPLHATGRQRGGNQALCRFNGRVT